jgi:hypothetical protein
MLRQARPEKTLRVGLRESKKIERPNRWQKALLERQQKADRTRSRHTDSEALSPGFSAEMSRDNSRASAML